MKNKWIIWELVTEGIATLDELSTTWSYTDAMSALAYKQCKKDIENEMNKRALNSSKHGNR